MEELRSHPSAKPIALVADAIRDCTRRGDIVLDTFAGSGTTILAAERVGRHARALEIEPRFVDVAIRRWQAFTGRDAHHAANGLSFDEIAADAPTGRLPPGEPRCIVAFGFTNPLLVSEHGELIAGHGRYKAAQLLGLVKVPVIAIAGLSPARQRALAIADNKIAGNAGWDRGGLRLRYRN